MKKTGLISLLVITMLGFVGCKSTDVTVPFPNTLPKKTEVVDTDHGKVQGIHNYDNTVELFAGVPYAKPPVGELRWKEPQEMDDWDDVYDASHFAPNAMQHQRSKAFVTVYNEVINSPGDRTDFAPMSEDCLYLNIWRPEGTTAEDKLPVLFYVHGGSLRRGSSWYEDWDGENMSKKGIVVVTIAYRVGIFGFFAHPELAAESPNGTTGNYGLLDQIKALKWVNKNIGAFGGDASNITIAGESAGSSSVSALCCSPLTVGLFERAIGESSSLVVPVPAHTFRSTSEAYETSLEAMEFLECKTLEEMKNLPAEILVDATYDFNAMTVDAYALPEYPWVLYQKGLNHEKALLNGFNSNEATAFAVTSLPIKRNLNKTLADSPYVTDPDELMKIRGRILTDIEAKLFYCEVFSAICFTYPHYSWTSVVREQGRPVYEYFFTKNNRGIGNFHTGEIIYAYGNLKGHKNYKKADYALQNTMTYYWSNFIKYGDPNGLPGSDDYGKKHPYWQSSAESNGLLLELGETVAMVSDPYTDIYQYLDYNIGDDEISNEDNFIYLDE